MIAHYEEISFNKAIEFPDYSESSWLSSSHLDPDSDFVQRRRTDLQVRLSLKIDHFQVLLKNSDFLFYLLFCRCFSLNYFDNILFYSAMNLSFSFYK